MKEKTDEQIKKAVADYQPGQRRSDQEKLLAAELKLLAQLLERHKLLVNIVMPGVPAGLVEIRQVTDFSDELHPFLEIEVR